MRKAVIVHCWGGKPDYAWYPWLKSKLEARGYQTIVPEMPDTDNPKSDKWLRKLNEAVGDPDKDLLLVGHSLGNVTIMRYLENLNDDLRVSKVIMVAGFTDDLHTKEIENFFIKPLNFSKIKVKSKNGFVAIQSDNDPYVAERYGKILENELNAKLIIKKGAKHMSGSTGEEGACTKLYEVLEEVG